MKKLSLIMSMLFLVCTPLWVDAQDARPYYINGTIFGNESYPEEGEANVSITVSGNQTGLAPVQDTVFQFSGPFTINPDNTFFFKIDAFSGLDWLNVTEVFVELDLEGSGEFFPIAIDGADIGTSPIASVATDMETGDLADFIEQTIQIESPSEEDLFSVNANFTQKGLASSLAFASGIYLHSRGPSIDNLPEVIQPVAQLGQDSGNVFIETYQPDFTGENAFANGILASGPTRIFGAASQNGVLSYGSGILSNIAAGTSIIEGEIERSYSGLVNGIAVNRLNYPNGGTGIFTFIDPNGLSGQTFFDQNGNIVNILNQNGLTYFGQDPNDTTAVIPVGSFGISTSGIPEIRIDDKEENLRVFIGESGEDFIIGLVNNDFQFDAGISIDPDGNSRVFADAKEFQIDHPKNPNQAIHYVSLEGPEAGAYTRGTQSLTQGSAEVNFPEHFAALINEKSLTIMLTPLSAQSKGLAVIKKTAQGFVVQELLGGTGSYSFDWEVKGIRKGYEDFQVIREKRRVEKPRKHRSSLPDTRFFRDILKKPKSQPSSSLFNRNLQIPVRHE